MARARRVKPALFRCISMPYAAGAVMQRDNAPGQNARTPLAFCRSLRTIGILLPDGSGSLPLRESALSLLFRVIASPFTGIPEILRNRRIVGSMNRLPSISAVIVAALSLAACTTRSPEALAEHDPFEPTNRFWFDVSQKADKYFAKPVAQGYVAVVPEPARDGLHNVLTNINQPVVFGNELLQGSPKRAASTLGRFVVNTTVGVAGLVDVATKIGLPDDDQDGGVTFGKWGLPEGPYLFLPLLGPAPPRDLLGRV